MIERTLKTASKKENVKKRSKTTVTGINKRNAPNNNTVLLQSLRMQVKDPNQVLGIKNGESSLAIISLIKKL